MKSKFLSLLIVLFSVVLLYGKEKEFPSYSGYVNDYADIISTVDETTIKVEF